MREVSYTTAFKRDYRRVLRSGHGEDAKETLARVVALLADDRPLPSNYADHPLKGPWRGFRECHLRPNLLLIYGNADASTLQLVRLGSHTQLFGSWLGVAR